MKSVAPGLVKLAAALLGAAAIFTLGAAEKELPPSKRNAPKGQKLEFYQSIAPQLPDSTPRNDDLQNRFGRTPERAAPDLAPAMAPYTPPPTPTKAFAEKMLKEMDRKKNWMFPGAQEDILGETWITKGIEEEDQGLGGKPKSVMERFLTGTSDKSKNKNGKGKESSTEKDEPNFRDSKEKNKSDDNTDSDRDRDGDASKESEGKPFSDFNLRSVLSPSQQRFDALNNRDSDRALQPLRNEIGDSDPRRLDRERDRVRERENARQVEFQQMIQPRGIVNGFSGIRDPINSAADLTRRDMNSIMPRAAESSRPESGPFSAPPSQSNFRIQDSGILGVAGPAATPNFSQPFAAPSGPANPLPTASQAIIIEPPKRKFN